MSSISNLSSGSHAWGMERPDPAKMKQRLFEKTDADGSGTVNTDELKTLLAQAAERSGQDLGDADTAMKTMDSNGDGSLDADELDQGLRELMPPPGSTVEFAQRRDGSASSSNDGDGGMQGMQGMPPPPPMMMMGGAGGAEGADGASADDVKSLSSALQQLAQVVDSDQDQTLSDSETERFGTVLQQALKEQDHTASSDAGNDAQRLTALIQRLVSIYQGGDGSTGTTTSGGTDSGSTSVNLSV
ncbi:MAG: EF-hand domain-containing protein [Proteobacteria bacterium]|nr:EF-hand domain-containing protein [Pseudomonadota bacterium]